MIPCVDLASVIGPEDIVGLTDGDPKQRPRQSSLLDPLSKKEKSLRQERRVAKRGSGHAVPGSGNQIGRPGDVRLRHRGKITIEDILVENKRSDNVGLYLSDATLAKHEDEAASDGRTPVFQFDIDGRKKGRKRWFLIPEELWEEFHEGM